MPPFDSEYLISRLLVLKRRYKLDIQNYDFACCFVRVLENGVLRRIFGLETAEVRGVSGSKDTKILIKYNIFN